ncbi:MAG TPA: tetratricopeptide repeat protein [Gemmatimonadaceae bacterium]
MATEGAAKGLPVENDDSIVDWAREHSNKLAVGGIVLAVVLAVGMLWRASAEKKEVNASAALARVEGVVSSGNAALAQSDLQDFLRRYDGTTASVQARMLLAKVLFSQGKAEEGLRELDQVSSPGAFASSYHALRASGLEQAERPAEAAAAYEAAAAAATSVPAKAANQADAARAYLNAGRRDDARRIWSAMAADDANPMSGEARVRLGELDATPG